MTDRDIMQQVLEALEFYVGEDEFDTSLVDALRERLAQPEQEPFSPEAIRITQTAWQMGYEAAREEILHALKLAQDALHMATLPFPVDEVKTQRALEAVTKVCDALGDKK